MMTDAQAKSRSAASVQHACGARRGALVNGPHVEISLRAIHDLMLILASSKCVFCSEMDFQLHLAWEMKEKGWRLSLEYDPMCFARNASIDILIEHPERVAVELKYKTALFCARVNGGEVRLKDQSAHDCGRYDFMKDLSRLEQVVAAHRDTRGVAIFLTNDRAYWRSGRDGTADAMFRMCGGRVGAGERRWGAMASPGTMRGRESPITLEREHLLDWFPYAQLPTKNGEFKYLLVEI